MVSASTNCIFLLWRLFSKLLAVRGLLLNLVRLGTGNKSLIITTRRLQVVEPLLDGIVLGLVFATLGGLFYAAYKQYKRGNQLGI